MRKKSDKLKIRIVMKPETAAARSAQYRYRWGRVALVLGVLLVITAVAGRSLFTDSEDTATTKASKEVAQQSSSAADQPAQTEPDGDTPTSPFSGETVDPDALSLPAMGKQEQAAAEQVEPAIDEQPTEQAPAAEQIAKQEPIAEVEPEKPATIVTPQTVTPPGQAQDQGVEPRQVDTPASAPLQAGKTRILSAKVKRFVLAKAIREREPRGSLEDITADSNGLITVYAFAEVVDSKNDVLYYRWRHNGKPVATVDIGVWSNRWRSNSSKYISANMRGEWQVVLENNKGDLLAETTFRY